MNIKSFTSLEQSKVLAEILPLESADMHYNDWYYDFYDGYEHTGIYVADLGIPKTICGKLDIPCWSLAILLKYLSEIKPQVYTPILFSSEGKWILQFVEYGHGNVCEMSYSDPIDACVAMIEKLHEIKLL